MAGLTTALIAGAATIGGAAIASNSQRRATSAVTNAARDDNALQAAIFEQQRADLAPWRASGAAALTEINRRLGLGQTSQGQGVAPVMGQSQVGFPMQRPQRPQLTGVLGTLFRDMEFPEAEYVGQSQTTMQPVSQPAPQSTPANPSDPQNRYGGFYASPGYQFRMDEGNRAITGNRAASGMLQSGDTLRALNRYGQDYASNEYNTQLNQLFSVAGLGQTATGQGNALASNYGAQVGANNQAAANALSSSYANQGNIWGSALGNLGGIAAYSLPNRRASSVPSDLNGLF